MKEIRKREERTLLVKNVLPFCVMLIFTFL